MTITFPAPSTPEEQSQEDAFVSQLMIKFGLPDVSSPPSELIRVARREARQEAFQAVKGELERLSNSRLAQNQSMIHGTLGLLIAWMEQVCLNPADWLSKPIAQSTSQVTEELANFLRQKFAYPRNLDWNEVALAIIRLNPTSQSIEGLANLLRQKFATPHNLAWDEVAMAVIELNPTAWSAQTPSTPSTPSKDATPYVRPEVRADTIMDAIEKNEDNGPMSELLHRLWTKAVGTEGYVKGEWQSLETVLYRLYRRVCKPLERDNR